jgi:hypothetical protein
MKRDAFLTFILNSLPLPLETILYPWKKTVVSRPSVSPALETNQCALYKSFPLARIGLLFVALVLGLIPTSLKSAFTTGAFPELMFLQKVGIPL